MNLEKILYNIELEIIKGTTDMEIADIAYDSRKTTKNCVFVCLKGFNTNGHKYAENAIKQGACAVVISDDIDIEQDITVIKVKDTRAALAYMSANFFGNPANKLKTIALTGTKGKTTIVAMIREILEKGGLKTGTIGTLGIVIGNNIYKTNNTTPESYEIQKAMRQMVEDKCAVMVIEASSLGLKWHRTDAINFDYGIFTNFSDDHIGDSEHKDLKEYLDCKALLFRQCNTGIINADDNASKEILKNALCDKIETYGITSNADLIAYDDKLISKDGYLGVHFKTKGVKQLIIDVSIPGRFSTYNALAAISVCRHFVDDNAIVQGLCSVTVKGRVEPVRISDDFTLLIDYAHNAMSMENVLSTLRQYNPNRLITMFGAGGNRPKSRRYEMGEISGKLSDLSVITEDNSRFEDVMDIIDDIKTGINKTDGKYVVVPNRKDAIRYCIENAQKGDIIVLAGKGHEDYQEIKGVKHHLDEREVIDDILKTL